MKDDPIACVHCGDKYPLTRGNWPSTTYAECWRCWWKAEAKGHQSTVRELMLAVVVTGPLMAALGVGLGWALWGKP